MAEEKSTTHNFDETRSNFLELFKTNIVFASFIPMALGTFATETTGFTILSVDFAMNVWTAIKISKTHKKINPNLVSNEKLMMDMNYNLSELALVEIVSDFQKFCMNSVNLAMDYTLEFDWIYGEQDRYKNESKTD